MNTVRTYDQPPPEMLDVAADHGLRLIVGVDYHDWRTEPHRGRRAQQRILDAGRSAITQTMALCAERPEVLAIAVGNEIPVDLVRLHGIESVTTVLSKLIEHVHAIDPLMMATYVNFPTTEFLDPRGQDLTCFNVFLEDASAFRRYVRHLQIVSADRPLVVTELGLAADLHGEDAQAAAIEAQLRVLDEEGAAGATVFSWTDDWAVDDQEVTGWGFGVTTRARAAKPALAAVAGWCEREIADLRPSWPLVSVVVCAYNEERTLARCLSSLEDCTYPNIEVIVCDDGSTDGTAEIARRFPFKTVELPHRGLSAARNSGLSIANGEIVAYLDADAACHPEWPFHLVLSMDGDIAATGGPNLPMPDAGVTERAVALSPGGPTEVLLTDDRAEHVPGCNMAFRKRALDAIGGFDIAYTAAGDDVDVCWKLLDGGSEIAFSPAAQVRHHRRASVRGYLRQQSGYGKAERMLAGPHRARFNRLGQATWRGFLYGGSRILPSVLRPVVYHGWQGQAPYQSISKDRAAAAAGWAGALLPIGLLLALAGAVLTVVSPLWLLLSAAVVLLLAGYMAAVAVAVRLDATEPHPARLRLLVGLLHVLQPFARTWGRLRSKPLSRHPRPGQWSGDRMQWLQRLESELGRAGCRPRSGGPTDAYDLQASVGPFIAARIAVAVVWQWEPRSRVWYVPRPLGVGVFGLCLAITIWQPALGVTLLAATALSAIVDLARLHSRVSSVMRCTTTTAKRGVSDDDPSERRANIDVDAGSVDHDV